MPNRIFLDASALFSAAYSATGASRELLLAAARDEVEIVVSRDVLEEVERNLASKAPKAVDVYNPLLALVDPEVAGDPTRRQVWAAEKHVAQKDAPIVAAAKKAKVDLLVTLDRKHLLGKPELAKYAGTDIVTPKEAVERLRKET